MSAALPRPRVLIVDDEPTNIRAIAAALADIYELRFATDADRALHLASATAFDLILLDVVMPGRDGFDLLTALRAQPRLRSVPVIFVTSMGESDDEARGLALGAVDYITKPANPAIVRARVATHVELKRQRDLLERHAFVDGLTGIANRRRFDQEGPDWLREAAETGALLSMLLIDIDHFKTYNDCYGHLAGDDCLRRVAQALAGVCPDALCARYGGEEFVLLDVSRDAADIALDLMAAVRALAMPHAGNAKGIVSISVGGLSRHADASASFTHWLGDADRLLFEAKGAGRDRAFVRDSDDDVHALLPEESAP